MKSCELCTEERESPILKREIENKLEEIDLNISRFIQLSPAERIGAIVNGFNLSTVHEGENILDLDQKLTNGDYGLLVIKPEAYNNYTKVDTFLSSELRLPIVFAKDFVYSPQQYWSMYGKYYTENFNQFPHGSLMFFISTILSSRIIVFRHLSPSNYHDIYRSLNPNGNIDNLLNKDRQAVFNTLLVKDPYCGIRKLVCEPITRNRGFLHMEELQCPAVCWDFAGEFRKRGELENSITFNGIHSPKDGRELIDNFAVLSDAVKIQI